MRFPSPLQFTHHCSPCPSGKEASTSPLSCRLPHVLAASSPSPRPLHNTDLKTENKIAPCPISGITVPSSAVSTTPSHSLLDARLLSGAVHSASLLSQAPISVKVSSRTASVGNVGYGGVICTTLGGRRGSREHHSPTLWRPTCGSQGASRRSLRAQGRRPGLNGILACFPDGATIRIAYPAAYCRLTICITRSQKRRSFVALLL